LRRPSHARQGIRREAPELAGPHSEQPVEGAVERRRAGKARVQGNALDWCIADDERPDGQAHANAETPLAEAEPGVLPHQPAEMRRVHTDLASQIGFAQSAARRSGGLEPFDAVPHFAIHQRRRLWRTSR
jgi:hypothetical protein